MSVFLVVAKISSASNELIDIQVEWDSGFDTSLGSLSLVASWDPARIQC